jgi:hypothetical protein
MGKITSTIVNNSWESISGVIDNLRTMIRSEVKEKGEYIIPKDDEMLSPTICYNGGRHPEYASNAYSCVEKIAWNEKYNDVMISCEDGEQLLRDSGMEDVFTLAETLAYFNEYGYHEDDEE